MKVAITGAGGYLGGLLVHAHVGRGDTVHVLTRGAAPTVTSRVSAFAADLTKPDTIPSGFFDAVDVLYHCAAELTREALMPRVNVEGTRALLAGARGRIRHWVQLSSVAVYGRLHSGIVNEDSPGGVADTYARTKLEADDLVRASRNHGFSHTLLRPSTVIGPHMRSRAVYSLLDALKRRIFFFIGPRGAILNYVHETNVVSALLLCATHAAAKNRTYNLSQDCEVEHVIEILAAAIERPPPRVRVGEKVARAAARIGCAVPGFPLTPGRIDALTNRVEYPATRITAELGYRHEAPVEAALRDLAGLWKRSRA